MRILWVKPGRLLPLDTGGKLRTFHILRHLAATHPLTFLSYYEGERDPDYEAELAGLFPGVLPLATGVAPSSPLDRRLDYVRRLPSRAPYAVSRFAHPRVREAVSASLTPDRYDVAICDFLASSLNFPAQLPVPTLLFQHNVESVLWQRRARLERGGLERLVARVEAFKMGRFEPAQCRRFDHVIAVSEADRRTMSAWVDPARITSVPTGVDLSTFKYDPSVRPAGPLVVFTGSMDWQPNIDGVEYFCTEIWHRVLAEVPEARFQIVGRDPDSRVLALRSPSVEVTGTVPSVVNYLQRAAVFVIPLRIGGGTRIKIYEGMAVGKATVSTTIGAEGLEVRDGSDILLADDPRAFAAAVVRLLRDEPSRRAFEAAAAETASRFDWQVIAARFAEVLEAAILERRSV